MKKSDIEKQLKDELNKATPMAFDELWQRCESETLEAEKEYVFELEKVAVGVENDTHRKGHKRLLTIIISFFAATLFVLVGMWGYVAGWFNKNNGGGSSELPMGKPTITKGYFLIDVNPSVEIGYDENGLVSEVLGLNADGKVLVYGMEEQMLGESYEKAIEELFNRCVTLGYFSVASETNAVLVSAIQQTGALDEEMSENARKIFSDKFVGKKMYGVAIAGKEDPALKEEAIRYGINTQKMSLIQEYLSIAGSLGVEIEIDEEEYRDIPIREIYAEMDALEEVKIGVKATDEITRLFQNLEEELQERLTPALYQELQLLKSCFVSVKSVDELSGLKEDIAEFLERVSDVVDEKDKQFVESVRNESEMLVSGAQANKEELHKPTEDKFKEREEKHKGDFDKESEEPEGGFEAWQDKNKEHFEKDWQGKKEDWKDRFDD